MTAMQGFSKSDWLEVIKVFLAPVQGDEKQTIGLWANVLSNLELMRLNHDDIADIEDSNTIITDNYDVILRHIEDGDIEDKFIDHLQAKRPELFIDYNKGYTWSQIYDETSGQIEDAPATSLKCLCNFFNLRFKKVIYGTKPYVMENDSIHKLYDKKDFITIHGGKIYLSKVRVRSGALKIAQMSAVDAWWDSAELYDDVCFSPFGGIQKDVKRSGRLNWFMPFVSPKSDMIEDAKPLIDFIDEIICSGNKRHQEYVWQWISHLYNNPSSKQGNGIALALQGKPGIGKSKFGELLSKLVREEQSCTTSSTDDLTGSFNSMLANKILSIGEESVWSGDRKQISRLKDLITSSNLQLRLKYKDTYNMPNHLRFLFLTNEDFVIASKDERRIFGLEVSDKRQKDTAYFRELTNLINSGAINGFAAYLVSIYNPSYDFQANFELTELVKDSADAYSSNQVEEWIESDDDFLHMVEMQDGQEIELSKIYGKFVEWAGNNRKAHIINNAYFAKLFKKIFSSVEIKRKGRAQRKYITLCDSMLDDWARHSA